MSIKGPYSMTDSTKPLPCPFCGCRPTLHRDDTYPMVECRAKRCGTNPHTEYASSGVWPKTIEEAIKLWNKRA